MLQHIDKQNHLKTTTGKRQRILFHIHHFGGMQHAGGAPHRLQRDIHAIDRAPFFLPQQPSQLSGAAADIQNRFTRRNIRRHIGIIKPRITHLLPIIINGHACSLRAQPVRRRMLATKADTCAR